MSSSDREDKARVETTMVDELQTSTDSFVASDLDKTQDEILSIMTVGNTVAGETSCLLDSQVDQSHLAEVVVLPGLSGLSASRCSSLNKAMCRICHGEEDLNSKSLIHPCKCSGTLRYVHQTCLLKWLAMSGSKKCELCQQTYVSKRKLNSVRDFRMLEMDSREKKILLLNNLLYLIGVVCNLWSELNFLRLISNMIRTSNLNWKFYIILFLCLTNNFCILALIVLISQFWYNLFKRFIRINQSVVILSR